MHLDGTRRLHTLQGHRAGESADLSIAQGYREKLSSDVFPGGGAENQRVLEFLGESFQARSQIDGFADHGVLQPVGRAYIAGGNLAGVNANADFQQWVAGSL